MTDVICDTSVVLKWFHSDGEEEVEGARRILLAHRSATVSAWVLDLTLYELGNVLLRTLRWPADDVAAQLGDLRAICGVLSLGDSDVRLAAQLAEAHELTFYDASYAAAARARAASLATGDQALIDAGVGESPSAIAARLHLSEAI